MLLPIDQIHIRPDARTLDESTVAGLVESIANVGLINAIRVRAEHGDGVIARWELIAGRHRLEAHKRLGLAEIEAVVAVDDDLRAELAMIDENLCRAELSPADRAKQTARRKAIYEELHPEAAHGKASPLASKDEKISSFASATATVTGQTERTVQLHAERGAKIADDVLAYIQGTELDNGKFLDRLKRLWVSDQMEVAKRELAELRRKKKEEQGKRKTGLSRRIVKTADAPLSEEEAREKWLAAGMSWWNRGSQEWREEFLARLDTPVFDRSEAA